MSPRGPRALTAAASLVVVAAVVWSAAVPDWDATAACASCAVAVAVAWVVVRRDAASPVGPALAWTTASIALVTAHVGRLAELPWSSGMWPLNLAGLLALLLVFPSGRSPGRLWSAVPWVFAVATAAMVAAQWGARQVGGRVVGEPEAAWAAPVGSVAALTVAACLLLASASLVGRYRRGARRVRQQVRWLLLAGLGVVVLLVGGWVAEAVGASLTLAYTPFLLAIVVLVPAAVGVAITRHDLVDVDRLLSGATAALLTALAAAAVFGAVVVAASSVLSARTGLTGGVAAFVTALVLLPLQRHLARWVGRVVDRDRYVAVSEVERFAGDVRAGRRQPEEVQSVLRQVQDDPDLVVHLARPDGGWSRLDGTATAAPDGFAIEAGGDVVAVVVPGRDSARARRRLADVAPAAWVPIEVARLRLVLREALLETEASRQRLSEASAAERRRLERELHDGAQQRVVATGMRLRLLQERLPGDLAREVDTAVEELRETVEELRRIAQGVRPALLGDGLAAALSAVKEASPLPFELTVAPLPDVSDVRTLTAYLVVNEAVANALKHAHATRIAVRVGPDADGLAVQVSDDGVGIPEATPLTALRDRIASVGGRLRVHTPPGGGTTIEALL